jgi:hypothetical protein
MRKRPTVKVDEDEWITIAWTGQHEECCDCGLKHRIDYRVVDGKLQFRGKRINHK